MKSFLRTMLLFAAALVAGRFWLYCHDHAIEGGLPIAARSLYMYLWDEFRDFSYGGVDG